MTQLDPDADREQESASDPAAADPRRSGDPAPGTGEPGTEEPGTLRLILAGRSPVPERQRRLVRIRRGCYAGWILVVALWLTFFGFPFDRNRLLVLLCLGLLTISIGRRPLLRVIRDWLPFALLLALYDLSRYLALALGMPTQWQLAVDADRWLFGGIVPTLWLQEHIKDATASWWEVPTSAVYMSFFLVPYVVAAFLWVRNRADWRKYVIRFVAISFAALIGYTLVPAAPPWAAARCTGDEIAAGPSNPECMYRPPSEAPDGGLLGPVTTHQPGAQPYVERISTRGLDGTGLTVATQVVESGQTNSNMVAAIPSLHAGLTALIAMFMWPRVRRRWRPLWAGYALTMAFALVYSAEHYVFDILIGWALAVLVLLACRPVDRWWERTSPRVRGWIEDRWPWRRGSSREGPSAGDHGVTTAPDPWSRGR